MTKAGTNTFHGTAWEFHRNSALNTRSYFLKAAGSRKPEQKQNQAGASAGGAVIANKLFWFGSYQRLWDRAEAGSSQTIVPTNAQRAGDFTALSAPLRNPVNPLTNAPFTDSSGAPCVANNIIAAGCISPVAKGLLDEHVPTSDTGTIVTLTPAPRDHSVYMGRGDYYLSPNNQLNAHFFADRSDSSSWPGNVNYVQQSVYSDVNQFGVSDVHVFGPRLVNEMTVSYLMSRSGGGAVTQIAPRDQGVNVDVGNDGRGMSYSVSGFINLAYPGVNAQDYYSWQLKDTMTYNVGNHTLKWGYELIRPVFEFNLALIRSENFQGTRTGNAIADFMVGAFENSTIEFGIADHSPSTMKHQTFIEDSYKVHPRVTLNYGLRYEPFIPFDQKGGRHTTWVPGVESPSPPTLRKASVPRRCGSAAATYQERFQQLRASTGRGVGRERRRPDRHPRRLRHLLPADKRREHARCGGAMARHHAAASRKDGRPIRLARTSRAAARITRQLRLFAVPCIPPGCDARIPDTDSNRLHGS